MWGDIMAPKPDHDVSCPPMVASQTRKEAIKNLRMIANDLERGYDGFNYFIGYDFINITDDILSGEKRRKLSGEEKYNI